MSSFRRRVTATSIPGTRPSPYNSLPLLSTGLSSLDDILGGGLPLSSSLLVESDTPTAYADLFLKFWVSQGVECKQDVVVVSSGLDVSPEDIVKALPGVEGGAVVGGKLDEPEGADDDDEPELKDGKMKIAFRYEGMKQHAVTVAAPTPKAAEADVYCSLFDLTTIRALRAGDRGRLHPLDVDTLTSSLPGDLYEVLYQRLASIISEGGYSLPQDPTKPRRALRIAIASLGSPAWGPSSPSSLYSFLHRLRSLLRSSAAAAFITFPAHLYRPTSPSLITRLEHACDGVIELQSFASSPLALAAFPRHNGLLRIPKLPSLGSLVPPSVKLSVLRGLGGADGMDNNLGFRVKRRRFIIETVNGDGPVGGDEPKKPKNPAVEDRKKELSSSDLTGQLRPVKAKEPLVRFEGDKDDVGTGAAAAARAKTGARASASKVIHANPELFEF
ncbi:hypothetical protein RQP46_002969 [Phenoliferia psychrophenolica]